MIRTSLVLDEQLQVLQVDAITVTVVARESEVGLEGVTLLTDVYNLVAWTIVRATESSGTGEWHQDEEQRSPHVEISPGKAVECTTRGVRRGFKADQRRCNGQDELVEIEIARCIRKKMRGRKTEEWKGGEDNRCRGAGNYRRTWLGRSAGSILVAHLNIYVD